jgi:predicted transposase YdaD
VDRPFDTTTRDLIEMRPEDWLTLAGYPPDGKVRVIDADLSTARYEADKVIRVDGLIALLIHLELQSTYDPTLPIRLLRYNVLLCPPP